MLYYLIYNPNYGKRHNRKPFELYKLVNGNYEKQLGEPYFMSEIGLGIGRAHKVIRGINREVLYWYDSLGNSYKNAEEQLLDTEEQLSDIETQLVDTKKQLSALEKEVIEYRKLFGQLPKDSS